MTGVDANVSAEAYAALCDGLSDGGSQYESWDYLENEFRVHDDFSVSLLRRMRMVAEDGPPDSGKRGVAPPPDREYGGDDVVLPTPETEPSARRVDPQGSDLDPADINSLHLTACPRPVKGRARIEVCALGTVRQITPVDPATIRRLTRSKPTDHPALDNFFCIPLQEHEYVSAPELSVTSDSDGSVLADLGGSLSHRFGPIAGIKPAFPDKDLPESVRISLPEYAHADAVVLRFRMTFVDALAGLLDSIKTVENEGGANPQQRVLALTLVQRANTVVETIRLIRRFIEEQATTLRFSATSQRPGRSLVRQSAAPANASAWLRARYDANNKRRMAAAVSTWAPDLVRLASGLGQLLKSLNFELDKLDGVPKSPNFGVEAARQLIELLTDYATIECAIPAQLDASGVVRMDELKRKLDQALEDRRSSNDSCEGASVAVSCSDLVVPFTTEREPHTLGRPAASLVLLLGVTLLVASAVSWQWLPDWVPGGVPRHLSADAPDVFKIGSPMATVLVVFPAILYSQLFHSRPRSAAGARAQMATFMVLSVLFALPVMPAAIISVGGNLDVASIIMLINGLAALVAGALAFRTFSPSALLRLRLKVVRRNRPDTAVSKSSIRPREGQ